MSAYGKKIGGEYLPRYDDRLGTSGRADRLGTSGRADRLGTLGA